MFVAEVFFFVQRQKLSSPIIVSNYIYRIIFFLVTELDISLNENVYGDAKGGGWREVRPFICILLYFNLGITANLFDFCNIITASAPSRYHFPNLYLLNTC